MHTTVLRLEATHARESRITEALAAIAAATFPLAAPADTPPQAIADHIHKHFTPEAFTQHLLDPAAHIWVVQAAREAEEIVPAGEPVSFMGYALVIADEMPADPGIRLPHSQHTAMLSKFYLSPEFHGRGLAGPLLARVIADLQNIGVRGLWLTVNDRNERANRFYRKHGFNQIGTQEFIVGADHIEYDFVLYQAID